MVNCPPAAAELTATASPSSDPTAPPIAASLAREQFAVLGGNAKQVGDDQGRRTVWRMHRGITAAVGDELVELAVPLPHEASFSFSRQTWQPAGRNGAGCAPVGPSPPPSGRRSGTRAGARRSKAEMSSRFGLKGSSGNGPPIAFAAEATRDPEGGDRLVISSDHVD